MESDNCKEIFHGKNYLLDFIDVYPKTEKFLLHKYMFVYVSEYKNAVADWLWIKLCANKELHKK